jgi:predicted regulator of Ras-like GTPase activity (Roadblock/LC7/MglB family)
LKRTLDPLRNIPGVRRAMLFSLDGVPIVHIDKTNHADAESHELADTAEDLSAFAGMASVLLSDIRRSVDPLSWGAPTRVVLAATRGTIILMTTERLNISVELDRGMAPEELRLPMESVIARLDRAAAKRAGGSAREDTKEETEEGPPGIFPAVEEAFDGVSEPKVEAGNQVPKTNTDS